MASAASRLLYRLYVGNLPWTIGSQELKNHFRKFGKVQSAFVIFDKDTGLSRKYGFVCFNDQHCFDTARNTQAQELEGNLIKVQPAAMK